MELSLAPLLLLSIVAGYAYNKERDTTRYKLARQDGHAFYFDSTYSGVVVTIITYCLYNLILQSTSLIYIYYQTPSSLVWNPVGFLNDYLALTLKYPVEQTTILWTLLLSPFFASYGARFLNLFGNSFKHLYDAIEKRYPFELLLAEAASTEFMVMITLEDDKVYVGFVYQSNPMLDTERKYISIIPVMSGYRGTDKRVKFTTYYDEVYMLDSKSLEHLEPKHYVVVLPIQKLVSARLFDPAAYDAFQQSKSLQQELNLEQQLEISSAE